MLRLCLGRQWRAHSHPKRLLSRWSFPSSSPAPTDEDLSQDGLPVLKIAQHHALSDRVMLTGWKHDDGSRDVVTYQQAVSRAQAVRDRLLADGYPKQGFVANLCVPGWEYVASLWGTWAAGHASVPLALTQMVPELEHVLIDTDPIAILVGGGSQVEASITHHPPNEDRLQEAADNLGMSDRIIRLSDMDWSGSRFSPNTVLSTSGSQLDDAALVLYTSGTTGKPKGVLSTHRNIYHQVTDLVSSWQWEESDLALHVLPLHHVHGLINILSCAAYVGARIDFRPFNAEDLWHDWALGHEPPATVLMAVPTIYAKLLEAAESMDDRFVESAVANSLQQMRLMVSGSAALPVPVLERWRQLTGHTLLERYGMTEFAMALSNPYQPSSERHPGHVGLPLPSVEVRIGTSDASSSSAGALHVKGPTVFKEYLNRPDATDEAFDDDGFFDTGDVAEYNNELNSYRILGRSSVDILKVGGHKLSALEIERTLLEHPDIAELAIVGVEDETWGQRVGAICRMKEGTDGLSLDALREWANGRMAKYRIPSRLLVVREIPKNAMGKVNKKDLVRLFDDA